MKRLFLLFSLLCSICGITSGQALYIDPATSAAQAAHAGVINGQLNSTNNKLTLIQSGQLAVTGQLTIVNNLQRDIYNGLSQVSAIMRNLLAVKDITEISGDIITDVNKALRIAQTNPALLLFAQQGATEFRNRATALGAEVGTFILQGGRENLMDSGERAKLLNRIVTELSILRGIAYGMYRTMFWVQQRGILNSLNPYAGFINIDKRIADNIIRNIKTLQR